MFLSNKICSAVAVSVSLAAGFASAAQLESLTATAKPSASPDSIDASGAAVNAWTVSAGTNTNDTFSNTKFAGYANWQIYSNDNAATITQTHAYTGALSIGQTTSIDFANRGVATGQRVGVRFLDSTGATQVEFSFLGGGQNYQYTDAGTGIGTYTTLNKAFTSQNVFNIALTLTGDTTYSMTAGANTGNTSPAATWTGTIASPITQIQVFEDSRTGSSDVWTANLKVVPEPASLTAIGVVGLLALRRKRRGA